MSDREPVFRVPAACLAIIAVMLAVHLLQIFGWINAEAFAVQPVAFWAQLSLHQIITLFTYQFLHAGWIHFFMNAMMLLAFGSAMIRLVGSPRFVIFYLGCGVIAAFAYLCVYPDSPAYLVGASGAISGVMGFVLWHLVREPHRRVRLIIALVISQVILVVAGSSLLGGEIAWLAHAAGFACGIIAALCYKDRV